MGDGSLVLFRNLFGESRLANLPGTDNANHRVALEKPLQFMQMLVSWNHDETIP